MGKSRSPRIMWWSNSPGMGTGYSTQTEQVVRRLKRRGHDVAVSSNYGQVGHIGKWNGIPVWPQGYDQYSQDVIWAHFKAFARESPERSQLVTLYDSWVISNSELLQNADEVWCWTPIDHMGVPPRVHQVVSRPNILPIAMSKHGQEAFARRDIESVYIPHALEKVWKPTPMDDPWPARWVVMMPHANKGQMPSRKSWAENVMAFAAFAKRHPEALLYLHCEVQSAMGIDLLALLKAAGVSPSQVAIVNQYEHRMGVPTETMAALYTRADVLLSASAGEGFGLPVLEAQACATRVVVSDFSAQSELVGDGVAVVVQPQFNPMQIEWFCTPLVHSIVEGLEWAFEQGGGHSQEAVDFAKQYDADKVFEERWVPLLDR